MSGRYEKITVIDLEATCWESYSDRKAGEKQEIIEVGAVEVNQVERKIVSWDSWLVETRTSTVSPFCEDLTGISQQMVDKDGAPLHTVLGRASRNSGKRVWASWGTWDRGMILRDCENRNVAVGWFEYATHINVAQMLCMMKGFKNRKGLKKGMTHTGVSWDEVMEKYGLEGMKQHRALPDALVTAEILLKLLGD